MMQYQSVRVIVETELVCEEAKIKFEFKKQNQIDHNETITDSICSSLCVA